MTIESIVADEIHRRIGQGQQQLHQGSVSGHRGEHQGSAARGDGAVAGQSSPRQQIHQRQPTALQLHFS